VYHFAALFAWPRTIPIQAFATLKNMLIAGFFLSHGLLILRTFQMVHPSLAKPSARSGTAALPAHRQ
jgi:hypothetical protein